MRLVERNKIMVGHMGVATTTDTTDSVRTSFEVLKNLYGMSVQVDETAKKQKRKVKSTYGLGNQL